MDDVDLIEAVACLSIMIPYEFESEFLSYGFRYLFLVLQAEKHDLDYQAGGSNASPVSCPEKWIMKSYFADSDALLDSHFQDFKQHKLYPCLCEALRGSQAAEMELSGLERRLIGEGSHRRLSSSIRIKFGEKSRANLPAYSCEVIIIEILPSGIFADPFELQHLLQRGGKPLLVPSSKCSLWRI